MTNFEEWYYSSLLKSKKNIQPEKDIHNITIIDVYNNLLSNDDANEEEEIQK